MAKIKRPFLKQKPVLYLDENLPGSVLNYFKSSRHWKKKIKVLSAVEAGNKAQPDRFHYLHCKRNGYTLVTCDLGFNDDRKYPFGNMPGIIMVKATKGDVDTITSVLATLLEFIKIFPFPKGFLGDTKFIVSREGCVVRGRDAETRKVKTFYVTQQTTAHDLGAHFSYLGIGQDV